MFLTGCQPAEQGDPAAEEIDVGRGEQAGEGEERPELEALEEDVHAPRDVDIEDPDRDPDTVLATVDGEEILLQDLYDEFARIPVHQQPQLEHQQHHLLEQMVQQQLLLQESKDKGIQETDTYQDIYEQFKDSPAAEDLEDEVVVQSALMEALLQKEVVEKAEISEEELRAIFQQYEQMMPEDADFEQMKPQLEQMVLRQHVNDYLQDLRSDAEIDIDEAWVEEKEEEAQPHPQQQLTPEE